MSITQLYYMYCQGKFSYPFGGELENFHSRPASRNRRRKGTQRQGA
jgi:hypothetical protein